MYVPKTFILPQERKQLKKVVWPYVSYHCDFNIREAAKKIHHLMAGPLIRGGGGKGRAFKEKKKI